jgi:hypothetical protein
MVDRDDRYASLRDLWEMYCSYRREQGIDVAREWNEWAKRKRESLKEFSGESSFDELCTLGCRALPLTVTIALFRPLQSFQTKWQIVTGPQRKREQKTRRLQKAADALEELQSSLADVMVAGLPLSPAIAEWLRREILSPSNLASIWPNDAPAPHPATTIRALRTYASMLRIFESVSEETGIESTDTLSKYLISAYVKRATGSFHDVEVSTLVGAALTIVYDETAHRMWRSRNYERLDKELSWLAELLFGVGVVTAQSQ